MGKYKQHRSSEMKANIDLLDPKIQSSLLSGTSVHSNINERIIQISETKLKLCLIQHIQYFQDKDAWLIPFGIFITLIITLVTADFKKIILPESTWQAIFVICAIISFCWTIVAIYKRPGEVTIDDLIQKIMFPDKKPPCTFKQK